MRTAARYAGIVVCWLSLPLIAADRTPSDIDLSLFGDLRIALPAGRTGWLKDGYGKTRYGAADGDAPVGRVGQVAVLIQPRLGWTVDGLVHLQAGDSQDKPVQLVEAFGRYRPVPTGPLRFRARAGLMYPPLSLENTGPAWSSPYALSTSAINSWVGEEVRSAAAELRAQWTGDWADFSVFGALTGGNDRAGTLLYRRGWALHDYQSGSNDRLPLPPRPGSPPATPATEYVDPFIEIDDRPGYYAGLQWQHRDGHAVNLIHWDNRADPYAEAGSQSAWGTRFTAVGGRYRATANVEIIAQALSGTTVLSRPGFDLIDDFRSLFVLASGKWGRHRLTGRIDWFGMDDREPPFVDTSESGRAGLAAYTYDWLSCCQIVTEALAVQSKRPSLTASGLKAATTDIQYQLALRWFLP